MGVSSWLNLALIGIMAIALVAIVYGKDSLKAAILGWMVFP